MMEGMRGEDVVRVQVELPDSCLDFRVNAEYRANRTARGLSVRSFILTLASGHTVYVPSPCYGELRRHGFRAEALRYLRERAESPDVVPNLRGVAVRLIQRLGGDAPQTHPDRYVFLQPKGVPWEAPG